MLLIGFTLPCHLQRSPANMDFPTTHSEPFLYIDSRPKRIHYLLLLIAPLPADLYRDACRLMTVNPSFETTTHLVGHVLREIESALRDVLEVMADHTKSTQKKGQLDVHKTKIQAILNGLGIAETDTVAQAWLRMPGKGYGLHARAHRDDLTAPRPVDGAFRTFWDEMESILDAVLAKFETRFLKPFKLLDELLEKSSPSATDVKKLRQQIPQHPVTLGYFFDKLSHPAWLRPLWEAHFFRHPREPLHDHDQGLVSFPPWPASRYLARMASVTEAQETVLTIALQIEATENIRVYEDLADVALALPANLGAQFVPQAKRWIECPYLSRLPQTLGALISHLAQGGQHEAALDLARSLFMALPDPRAEEEAYSLTPEPRARFTPCWYEHVLHTHAPDLVAAAGMDALQLFCMLLDAALLLSRRLEEEESPEDSSCYWRPAVEDS